MPIWIVYVAGGIALVVLVAGAILAFRPQPSVVEERLGRFAEAGATPVLDDEPVVRRERRGSPIGERLNEAIQGLNWSRKIRTQLARADLKLNAGEYLSIIIISSVGSAFVMLLFTVIPDCTGSSVGLVPCLITRNQTDAVIMSLIGGAIGIFLPGFYVKFRQGQRLKAFDNMLADTLNLMVNGLRSGYSIMQAMEAVSRELPEPASIEFRRVVQEMQLGLTMEDALDHMLDRINSEDLDLVVTAINVQREVGGNLAEILETISHTIRERVRIKGEIKVLTAQGMATGYAITGLPIALTLLLWVVNRPYIALLFEGMCGWLMIGTGIVMIAVGGVIIRKIVNIEV